jgi:hypothetical protein
MCTNAHTHRVTTVNARGIKQRPEKVPFTEHTDEFITVLREGVGAGGRNDPSLVCTYE